MERTTEYLKELQSLPLDEKVAMTKMRIVEWYEHWNGNVSVSFSGGKDSTVLLDIVRSIYPDVPAVFVDTGLEQPEIREFVRRFDNVIVVRPSMPFNEVLSTYGYPLISKEVSEAIWYARKNTPPVNKKLSGGGIQTEASQAVGPETDRGGYATRTRDGICCSDDGSANAATFPNGTAPCVPPYAQRNIATAAPRERERELTPKHCDDALISCSNTMSPQFILLKNAPIIRSGSPVSLSPSTPINGAISSSDYLKRERERERESTPTLRHTRTRRIMLRGLRDRNSQPVDERETSAILQPTDLYSRSDNSRSQKVYPALGGAANPRPQSTIQESNCILREGQKEKGDTCRGRFVTHDGASKSKSDDGEYP